MEKISVCLIKLSVMDCASLYNIILRKIIPGTILNNMKPQTHIQLQNQGIQLSSKIVSSHESTGLLV